MYFDVKGIGANRSVRSDAFYICVDPYYSDTRYFPSSLSSRMLKYDW